MGSLPEDSEQPHEPIFGSFGLVVLDEIKHPTFGTLHNVLGGSGTFGARLAVGAQCSQSVVWLLRVGSDFPEKWKVCIAKWGLDLYVGGTETDRTTRGLLEYHDALFDAKSFRYTTPVVAASISEHLPQALKISRSYHFLARASDFIAQLSALLSIRAAEGLVDRPIIVWEPSPLHCHPDEYERTALAAREAFIVSPNHMELAKLCGYDEKAEKAFSREEIEALARRFLASANEPDLWIVVRAAEKGCFVASMDQGGSWVPAFHGPETADKVIDPTGAGNAFLGALCASLASDRSVLEACRYGAVAASFMIEQIGLPELTMQDGSEKWNHDTFDSRLETLRLKSA